MPDQTTPRRSFLKGALTAPVAVAAASSLLAPPPADAHGGRDNRWRKDHRSDDTVATGPSTASEPYVAPSIAGVKAVSILTVGEAAANGYRMVGIPDGLGAFVSGRNEFTLLMNHELTSAAPGIVRAHGSNGAFVSRWIIDSKTLKVARGEDFTKSPNDVFVWDKPSAKYVRGTTQWQRHCSADLAAPSAYFANGVGTRERLYLNGEEVTSGRGWARVVTGEHAGEAWHLPLFGGLSYENAVACPYPQRQTIVALTDDSNQSTASVASGNAAPSQVYFYIGTKYAGRHPVDSAGLTNGRLFGLSIHRDGVLIPAESDQYGLGDATSGYIGAARFTLVPLADEGGQTISSNLDILSDAHGVARLQRCEDGAWDPRDGKQGDFYFVTTASSTANCRLWCLSFDDIGNPLAGGTVEILLRGDEGHRMLDNVTIDRLGRVLMDEDPGNDNRIAKVWLYSIDTEQFLQVAAHNPVRFDPDSLQPEFITRDEETTGIIDAGAILGEGWFLLNVQAHKASADAELVEGGQLLALYVDPAIGLVPRENGNRHDDNQNRR